MHSNDYRLQRLLSYVPTRARLEASTICQLKCEGCSFQNNNHSGLGGGFLSFENFKRFVDQNPFIKEIELSNYGEIFLNPYLIEIMKYGREKGVELNCMNGANFNTVSEEQMRALVENKFSGIVLSIDGACNETYSKYRIGGNFDTVINNVRCLQHIKRAMHSEFPKLYWQFVPNEYNELEIGKAKEMARELGIEFRIKPNWDPDYQPKNVDYIKKETGSTTLTEAEYTEKIGEHAFDSVCSQFFSRPQINWDGRLLGCCTRQYAAFDVNVFEDGLKKAIFHPEYMEAKLCLLTVYPDPQQYANCVCMNCEKRLFREKLGVALNI